MIGRLLELREVLVEKNGGVPFFNLDEVLVDLKLGPEVLEVPVPKYIVEDQGRTLAERERLLDALLKRHASRDEQGEEDPAVQMDIDEALKIIQANERGRQGQQRAEGVKAAREREAWEERRRAAEEEGDEDGPEAAATSLQAAWRGSASRRATALMRDEELVFIGMAPPPPFPKEGDPRLRERQTKARRKQMQMQHEAEYRDALVAQDAVVYETEGPDMKEEMMDQLRDWYIRYREREGKFPDFPPEEVEKPMPGDAAEGAEEKGADAKKDPKKDGKKDGKKGAEDDGEGPPPLPPHFINTMKDSYQEWSDKWQHRDERLNFAQRHDVELVRQSVRPDVELRVRAEVNELIGRELQNLQEEFERAQGKKGKKGKGGKGGKKKK